MPRISQKKLDSLKGRARSTGKKMGSTVKSSAIQAVTGVAAFFAHSFASENIEFVRDRWWVGPVGLAVAGHFAKKRAKMNEMGAALLGAAGYAGAFGWKLSRANVPAETGALYDPRRYDAGALIDPRDNAPALPSSSATAASRATEGSVPTPGVGISDAMGLGL